jgi:general L-amino acid transport system substrate-binding protein
MTRIVGFAKFGCLLAGLLVGAVRADAGTFDDVRARGSVVCGVNQGLAGFATRAADGSWSGFDVDYCRAVAAAVVGDPAKVTFVPVSAAERFDALKAGRIDLLSRNSTWTLEREGLGLLFAGIDFHDGQGFLVVRRPEVTSPLELAGAKICVQAATTAPGNLADFFASSGLAYTEVTVAGPDQAIENLERGVCDVFSTDVSALYVQKARLADPAKAVILPDVISKEPFGPVVRADDVRWFNAVKWVNFALIDAEELGITKARADEALRSKRPAVRRFTGVEGGLGAALGLDDAWAIRAVKAVGNYGEIYEANLGAKSPLAIPRGLNHSWATGGILYAPPVR